MHKFVQRFALFTTTRASLLPWVGHLPARATTGAAAAAAASRSSAYRFYSATLNSNANTTGGGAGALSETDRNFYALVEKVKKIQLPRSVMWNSNQELVDKLKDMGLLFSEDVYEAMRKVDRLNFVNKGVTLNAPFMHSLSLELLRDQLQPGNIALDVGSGAGYLTSCMAHMVGVEGQVYGIECQYSAIEVAKRSIASDRFSGPFLDMGIIRFHLGDGRKGIPTPPSRSPKPQMEILTGTTKANATTITTDVDNNNNNNPELQFDAIHVGAAVQGDVPPALLRQLKKGGRMVIPIISPSTGQQTLVVVQKRVLPKDQVVAGGSGSLDYVVERFNIFPVKYEAMK